ncbi:MAG: polyprenyl synthetase family protein [Bacteroidetes bacterium]|uniref:Polyprenyl synthetase family protein n=1 Tax=Candidatus Limisoma faecipullorum TaxID=2840854 RepID=A0A9D9IPC2_9BACT|nr:polyprenyl synthetase family protein [Candidatus Limisoma faecipullorum]
MRTIEEYIRLAEKAVGSIKLPKRPAGLYEPITYGLSNGGKRLRPALLLAACEAAGKDCTAALSQAAAIEMFHNFTLLHDDVMDNADLRRGKPTVCRKWDNNTAILSGDTMLTLATQLLVEGVAPDKAARLLDIFNRAAIGVYEGQQYDMEFESRNDVTEEEYIDMIRLKTSVLLGCAAQLGAEIGDAEEQQGMALYGFAMNLGIAFQLQDDWLDVYGDPAVFGKATGGDIMNNKKTFLLIKAMELAEGNDKKNLQYWLDIKDADPEKKISAVTAIYDSLGIGDICQKSVEKHNAEALRCLGKSGLTAEAAGFFEEFDRMVMNRKK